MAQGMESKIVKIKKDEETVYTIWYRQVKKTQEVI